MINPFLSIIKKSYNILNNLFHVEKFQVYKTNKTSNISPKMVKYSSTNHKHNTFLSKNTIAYTSNSIIKQSGKEYYYKDFLPREHDHSKYLNNHVYTQLNKDYITNRNLEEIVPPNKKHFHKYYLKTQKLLFENNTLTANKGIGHKVLNDTSNYPNSKYVIHIGGKDYTGYLNQNLFFFNKNYYSNIQVQDVKFNYAYNDRYKEVMKLKAIDGDFLEREYALFRIYLNGEDLYSETIPLIYNNGNLELTKNLADVLPGSTIGYKINKEYLGKDIWLTNIPKEYVSNIIEVFDNKGNKKNIELVNDREKFEFINDGVCIRGTTEDEELYLVLPVNISNLFGEYEIKYVDNGYIVLNGSYYEVDNFKTKVPIVRDTINSISGIKTFFELDHVIEKSNTFHDESVQPSVISKYNHVHSEYSSKDGLHRYSSSLSDIYGNQYTASQISPKSHLHEDYYISSIVAKDIFMPKDFSIQNARGIQDFDKKYKIGIFRYDIRSAYNKGTSPVFDLDLYKAQTKGKMYLPNLASIEVTGGNYHNTTTDYLVPLQFSINGSLRTQIEKCMNQISLNVSINITPESIILQKIQEFTGQKDLYESFLIEPIKSQMVINRVNINNSDFVRDGIGFLSPAFSIGTLDNEEIFKAIGSYRTKTFSQKIYDYSFEYNQEQLNNLGYSFGQFEPKGFTVYNFGLPFTTFLLKEV